MFKSLKGKLTSASCRNFFKHPDAQVQARLKASGWGFHEVENGGEYCYSIIHPDGKMVDGFDMPEFNHGFPRTKERKKAYEDYCRKRWHDFALACADHPDAPRRSPKTPAAVSQAPAAVEKPGCNIGITIQL
jgi:hypothetical protein